MLSLLTLKNQFPLKYGLFWFTTSTTATGCIYFPSKDVYIRWRWLMMPLLLSFHLVSSTKHYVLLSCESCSVHRLIRFRLFGAKRTCGKVIFNWRQLYNIPDIYIFLNQKAIYIERGKSQVAKVMALRQGKNSKKNNFYRIEREVKKFVPIVR